MNPVPLGGLRCTEVLAHLSELLDGTLAAPLVVRVREHLAGCRDCERFGGAVAAVLAGLRAQWRHESAGGVGDVDPAVAARLDAAWRPG
jgi:predicted anti-sigma-YlaC factor YlaD